MESLGLKAIGDLAKFDVQRLVDIFGKTLGVYFHNSALGVDNTPVMEQGEAESISKIGTLKQDTRDLDFILQKTGQLTDGVYEEFSHKNLSFRQVAIMVITTDRSSKSRSITLEPPAKDKETIRRNVRMLMEKFLEKYPQDVRRVGVKISGFTKQERKQQQLTSFF